MNPVSLYVEEESVCLSELADEDVLGCERNPIFRDYLKDVDSDSFTMELSQLFEAKADVFKFQPADRLLRIILWSWLDDEEQICDIDSDQAEELGLDLAISPGTIQKLGAVITSFNHFTTASALFAPNESWDSEDDLANYLKRWKAAFSDALTQQKGLYFKIWV